MMTKLLLLAIAIVAIWYVFKILRRRRHAGVGAMPAIENTVKCLTCGVYVPAAHAAPCGRAACPYRSKGGGAGAP